MANINRWITHHCNGSSWADQERWARDRIKNEFEEACGDLLERLGYDRYMAWVEAFVTEADDLEAVTRKARGMLANLQASADHADELIEGRPI